MSGPRASPPSPNSRARAASFSDWSEGRTLENDYESEARYRFTQHFPTRIEKIAGPPTTHIFKMYTNQAILIAATVIVILTLLWGFIVNGNNLVPHYSPDTDPNPWRDAAGEWVNEW